MQTHQLLGCKKSENIEAHVLHCQHITLHLGSSMPAVQGRQHTQRKQNSTFSRDTCDLVVRFP